MSQASNDTNSDALTEATMRSLGILVILGAGVFSLTVGANEGTNDFLTTFGLPLAFVFIGFSIYRHASSGLRSEIRVDTRMGSIRVGNLNSKTVFTAKREFQRAEVDSVFIQRSKTRNSKLCLRLKKNTQAVAILEASERDLVPVLERLFQVLFAPDGSKNRVKTRVDGGMIQVGFA